MNFYKWQAEAVRASLRRYALEADQINVAVAFFLMTGWFGEWNAAGKTVNLELDQSCCLSDTERESGWGAAPIGFSFLKQGTNKVIFEFVAIGKHYGEIINRILYLEYLNWTDLIGTNKTGFGTVALRNIESGKVNPLINDIYAGVFESVEGREWVKSLHESTRLIPICLVIYHTVFWHQRKEDSWQNAALKCLFFHNTGDCS